MIVKGYVRVVFCVLARTQTENSGGAWATGPVGGSLSPARLHVALVPPWLICHSAALPRPPPVSLCLVPICLSPVLGNLLADVCAVVGPSYFKFTWRVVTLLFLWVLFLMNHCGYINRDEFV